MYFYNIKPILIILHGARFPYHLMKFSFAHARQYKVPIHILFLEYKHDFFERHGYQDDFKNAGNIIRVENNEKDELQIIRNNMKLVSHMAISEKINFTAEHITNCPLNKISNIIQDFEQIFIEAGYDEEHSFKLYNTDFILKNLIEQAPSKLVVVSEDLEYS